MTDKKAGELGEKWAVITRHPWLPTRGEQLARARSWGVPVHLLGETDLSPVIYEDARGIKTTNWPSRLPKRADFFERLKHMGLKDVGVFFATPLCVGFSELHARDTVSTLFGLGCSIYVHTVKDNGSALYVEGDDMEEFFLSVGHLANAAHQRVHKAARRSRDRSAKDD